MNNINLKEILVLHHSHLDIGFTHSQPILIELQRDFISQALDFLDETADWDEADQPKWTCEATFQVMTWLETANVADIGRFEKYLAQGRLGISALQFHLTPLDNAEQIIRHLYPAQILRDRFGVALNTVNLHDVDGLPWSAVDIFLDSGIELLIMAVNPHLGRAAAERPSIFRWQGPSGRHLLVMNGAHYTMLDQFFYTDERNLERMAEGLEEYTAYLAQHNYPHDFTYLTTTDSPVCFDNASPNMDTAQLIRRWNQQQTGPPIRYIVPEELLARIKDLDQETLPFQRGDWTDFWNFGCASTAVTTKVNLNTKPRLYTADFLSGALAGKGRSLTDISNQAWDRLNRYDEHTWGAFPSWEHDSLYTRSQAILKETLAYEAHELTGYVLLQRLEEVAQNPLSSWEQAGVMVVNSTARERIEYIQIPSWWRDAPKYHRTARLGQWGQQYDPDHASWCGPVTVPPFSAKFMPLTDLPPSGSVAAVTVEDGVIESLFYRLEYETENGRITSLFDKQRNWEIAAQDGDWSFFEFVHERPTEPTRKAFYDRDLTKERFGLSCWNKDWHPVRTGPERFLGSRIEKDARGVTLVRSFDAPGMKSLEQRLTLLAHSPLIELSMTCIKEDIREPEAGYLAFPLNLEAGWQAHFDTGGVPVELDREQLPGACRDWVTAESYTSLHNQERGVTLYCPDAPMVQVGDFNFGLVQEEVPRNANPLLLAWPLNNYWDTNFRATQPGHIHLRYFLSSHGPFDPNQAFRTSRQCLTPLEVHPAIDADKADLLPLLSLVGEGVELLHLSAAQDDRNTLVRLINLSSEPSSATVTFAGRRVVASSTVNPLEQPRPDWPQPASQGNSVTMKLKPGQITTLMLTLE